MIFNHMIFYPKSSDIKANYYIPLTDVEASGGILEANANNDTK